MPNQATCNGLRRVRFKTAVLMYKATHGTAPSYLENSYHVLYPYLPENQYQHYHLRQRLHNKVLIPKTTYLSERDYIMRMLYKNCY